MDAKTLEWMNERTKKGNEVQKKIKTLKEEIEKVKAAKAACIGFYDLNSPFNWQSEAGYSDCSKVGWEFRKFIYNTIAEPLIVAFEKEIEGLEAEFEQL